MSFHVPVLLKESINGLNIDETKLIVDCTFGSGGHTKEILMTSENVTVIAIDRDSKVKQIASKLKEEFPNRLHFTNGLFSQIDALVLEFGISSIDGVLYDFGFSSMQIDDPSRGFSFNKDGLLSMQMGNNELSAYDVVNLYPEKKLADIIFYYGDERLSRRIAKFIVTEREKNSINTTLQLATIISNAIPKKYWGKTHPATKSFQAIRIEVNNELNEIKQSLHKAFNLLRIGGRICTISFHSLEDRIVKEFIRSLNSETTDYLEFNRNNPNSWEIKGNDKIKRISQISKVQPNNEEIRTNPRARSAKLRILEKLANH